MVVLLSGADVGPLFIWPATIAFAPTQGQEKESTHLVSRNSSYYLIYGFPSNMAWGWEKKTAYQSITPHPTPVFVPTHAPAVLLKVFTVKRVR